MDADFSVGNQRRNQRRGLLPSVGVATVSADPNTHLEVLELESHVWEENSNWSRFWHNIHWNSVERS
jgi:hypothetical protein